MSDIHAHNLLNLLRETPMSRDELAQHFGADVRFHRCALQRHARSGCGRL